MQVAGPLKKGKKGNKDAAKKFYAKAMPKGSTNIYDALRAAFKVAGAGTKKKNAPLHADTIYCSRTAPQRHPRARWTT